MAQNNNRRPRQKTLRVGIFIITVLGGLILYAGAKNIILDIKTLQWPKTDGVIIASEVHHDTSLKNGEAQNTYKPSIRYKYTLSNQEFESDQIQLGGIAQAYQSYAVKKVGEYPIGAAIDVYYNPNEVKETVLEPGISSGVIFISLFGLVFFTVGLTIWCFIPKTEALASRDQESRSEVLRAQDTVGESPSQNVSLAQTVIPSEDLSNPGLKLKHSDQPLAERKRLYRSDERRGLKTGFPVWVGVLFGGLALAPGLWFVLVGLKKVMIDPSTLHAPYWVVGAFGGLFFTAGLIIWQVTLRQYLSDHRYKQIIQQYRGSEAIADFPWNPHYIESERWKRAIKALSGTIFFTLFLLPFNYLAIFMIKGFFVKFVIGIFDLALFAAWWETCLRVGRAIKFGGSRIVFDSFPYKITEPVVIRWNPAEGITLAEKGSFTLHCVEEWYETSGSGKNNSKTLVHEEIWRETWLLDQLYEFRRGEELKFQFIRPTDANPTKLNADKSVFWEFEVNLSLPGLDFEETYLVPIYANS